MTSLPKVAFWLMPEQDERKRLETVIADLARACSTPRFAPHVTLYSCRRSADQAELALLARLAAATPPLTLTPKTTEVGQPLAQALFWSIPSQPRLTALFQALHAGVAQPSDYRLQPHLSLLYSDLPSDRRRELGRTLCPPAVLHCNELRAVAIPARLATMDDFRGWQTLLSVRLQETAVSTCQTSRSR